MRLWQIVLIHNAKAKEALKMMANHTFAFDSVIAKEDTKLQKAVKVKKESNKKKAGHVNVDSATGPKEAAAARPDATKKDKRKPLILKGKPDPTAQEREAAVSSLLQLLQSGDLDEACEEVGRLTHPDSLGNVLEHLVICLMEADGQTRAAGGNLLHNLTCRHVAEKQVEGALNSVLKTAGDMAGVLEGFWAAVADIFCPLLAGGSLAMVALKDSAAVLSSESEVGAFLAALLNQLARAGKMKTHKSWKDSGLRWTDFVVRSVDVEAFLDTHHLRWLGTGDLELEPRTADLLNFLEDEDTKEEEEENEEIQAGIKEAEEEDENYEKPLIEF